MLFPGVNHCSSQLPKRQVFTARHFRQPWFRGVQGGANMWPERPFELGRNTCAVTAGGTSQLQDETAWCLCVKLTMINGDVNLCIGSTATLACFGVKLLSTMSQLYIGSAAKLLCFCVKTTKGNFKLCIGSVAKLLRELFNGQKRKHFLLFLFNCRNP